MPTLPLIPVIFLIKNYLHSVFFFTPIILYLLLLYYSLNFLLVNFIILKIIFNPKNKQGFYELDSLNPAIIYYTLNEVLIRINEELFRILLIPKALYAEILFSLFGAKKGKNVHLNPVKDPYLVEIGDNTIIGQDSFLLGHEIVNNKIYLKKVKIGKNVTIGAQAIISPGCIIEDNVIVGANSFVKKNSVLKKGYFYAGSPAKKIKKI